MNQTLAEKIKAKLDALKKASEPKERKEFAKNLWKPTYDEKTKSGKHLIRILPNKYAPDPDLPFVDLSFYHDFGKKYQLAPISNNNPDPIAEFASEIRKTDWELFRKLQPKSRTFVPILVRGAESEGIKFWGFSTTIYNKILSIMDDADYGDIADLETGNDLTVDFSPATKKGEYDKVDIIAKPKKTRYTDDPEVEKAFREMIDLKTTFTEPTYEELRVALEKYLETSTSEEQPATEDKPAPENKSDDNKDFDPKKLDATHPPKAEKTKEIDDVEAAFEAIIAGKS